MRFCSNCGKELREGETFCSNCGNNTTQNTNQTMNQDINQTMNPNTNTTNQASKSKMVAGLLGIFLGGLGVHNFYLGYTGKAIAQLLISILSFGFLAAVSSIWGLIEGILILTGSIDKDANGNKLGD